MTIEEWYEGFASATTALSRNHETVEKPSTISECGVSATRPGWIGGQNLPEILNGGTSLLARRRRPSSAGLRQFLGGPLPRFDVIARAGQYGLDGKRSK
jgi:hypothetical protein